MSAITYRDYQIPAVYLITNTVNGKVYVGQTVNLYKRRDRHRRSCLTECSDRRPLVAAFRKYGFHNFSFSILETPLVVDLTEREQFWMNFYRSYERDKGYNAAPAAGSCLGVKHSAETKAKVALASRGRRHTPLSKLRLSIAHTGKIMSPSTRERIRLAKLGTKIPNKAGRRVEQIDKGTLQTIAVFCSASAAHRAIGGGPGNILYACSGKRSSAGGYAWRFACLK